MTLSDSPCAAPSIPAAIPNRACRWHSRWVAVRAETERRDLSVLTISQNGTIRAARGS